MNSAKNPVAIAPAPGTDPAEEPVALDLGNDIVRRSFVSLMQRNTIYATILDIGHQQAVECPEPIKGVKKHMRADWREVPRDNVKGQWAALYVTMNRKGFLVMSRLTFQRMGEPKAFVLLFDQVNNRIGLKPAHASTRNAYHIGPWGSHGGKVVRAYRMMQEFGIAIPETIRFHDPEIDQDGILILDLRTARVTTRGGNEVNREIARAKMALQNFSK